MRCFYNARHYDLEIGRFVTADTVTDGPGTIKGWNRYMYVGGNPIMYKDPTGHHGLIGDFLSELLRQTTVNEFGMRTAKIPDEAMVHVEEINNEDGTTEYQVERGHADGANSLPNATRRGTGNPVPNLAYGEIGKENMQAITPRGDRASLVDNAGLAMFIVCTLNCSPTDNIDDATFELIRINTVSWGAEDMGNPTRYIEYERFPLDDDLKVTTKIADESGYFINNDYPTGNGAGGTRPVPPAAYGVNYFNPFIVIDVQPNDQGVTHEHKDFWHPYPSFNKKVVDPE
ncbi:MAG: RHS repeat-associated core domain-containing protein [Leptospirales bacterium]